MQKFAIVVLNLIMAAYNFIVASINKSCKLQAPNMVLIIGTIGAGIDFMKV